MGQRAASTTGVTFEDVRVPKEASSCFMYLFIFTIFLFAVRFTKL